MKCDGGIRQVPFLRKHLDHKEIHYGMVSDCFLILSDKEK